MYIGVLPVGCLQMLYQIDQQIIIVGMVLVTAANKNTVIKNTKVNTHGFPKTHLRVIKYIAIKWLTPDCSTMPATIIRGFGWA